MRMVTHVTESCHTYEWVMWHIWISHVTHMNESCHTYEWVMSHIWMSHVTHMNESWIASWVQVNYVTHEWVMSHIWMCHVTHLNASCHELGKGAITFELQVEFKWIMSHVWMNHVPHTSESCHTYECVMSHTRKRSNCVWIASWMRHQGHVNWPVDSSCVLRQQVLRYMYICMRYVYTYI